MVKKQKRDVHVYAEGGGDHNDSLGNEFREAFSKFLGRKESGVTRRPKLHPCGSRKMAYDDFKTALAQGRDALLLVDSEAPIAPVNEMEVAYRPWAHLRNRDGWAKPENASDEDCHLMVQCMESWFVADWETTSKFFGQGFETKRKPSCEVELIAKDSAISSLELASKPCKTKGQYGKGAHSFKLLALIDPAKVMQASPWAKRFIDELKKRKP